MKRHYNENKVNLSKRANDNKESNNFKNKINLWQAG